MPGRHPEHDGEVGREDVIRDEKISRRPWYIRLAGNPYGHHVLLLAKA
jgi:hypothetical protein